MLEETPGASAPERLADDRRSSMRFPLKEELRYRCLNSPDNGFRSSEVINMSSRGVLFRSQEPLRKGEWLEIYVTWPAQLNQQIGLQLVVRGPVVRIEQDRVAVSIQQHEFRTQGQPKPAPPGLAPVELAG